MYTVCVQTTSATIYYANLIQIFLLCICYKNCPLIKVVRLELTANFPREARDVAHIKG